MNILATSVALGRALTPQKSRFRWRTERNGGHEPVFGKLAFIVLLLVIVDCFNAQAQIQENDCFQGQYYNLTTNVCVSCTNCSSLGQVQLSLCSEHEDAMCDDPQDRSDCIAGEEFYDTDLIHCQPCTECKRNEEMIADCRIDEDTHCVQRCAVEFIYLAHLGVCQLNCDYCPNGACRGLLHCQCQPERCYAESDFLCRFTMCEESPDTPTTTTDTSSSTTSLEPWGIGLVAVGVVIGIVAFSACFLMMGMCTSSPSSSARIPRPDIGSEESQSSQSGLVVSSNDTSGTTTTSLGGHCTHTATPVITCKNGLEAARQQSQQNFHLFHHQVFHSSMIKNSPSPRSLRTGGSGRKEAILTHV